MSVLEAATEALAVLDALAWTTHRTLELFNAPVEILTLQELVDACQGILSRIKADFATNPDESYGVLAHAITTAAQPAQRLDQLIKTKLLATNRTWPAAWLEHQRKITVLTNRLKFSVDLLREAALAETLLESKRVKVTPPNGSRSLTPYSTQTWTSDRLFSPDNRSAGSSYDVKQLHQTATGNAFATSLGSPLGMLESSPSFHPAGYTASTVGPGLFAYFCKEIDSRERARVNQYTMLFAKDPRSWLRFVLMVVTTAKSDYWAVEKCQSTAAFSRGVIDLPRPLRRIIEQYLLTCIGTAKDSYVKQDFRLNIIVGQADSSTPAHSPRHRIWFSPPGGEELSVQRLRAITASVRQWNCPQYLQRALTMHSIWLGTPNYQFVTYVDSQWGFYVAFGADAAQNELYFRTLRITYAAKGRPGVTQLLGVVFDSDTSMASGYIIALPANGFITSVLEVADQAQSSISFQRREKWCRSIVEGVASIHETGNIVGSLADRLIPKIAICANDEAVLFGHYRPEILANSFDVGTIPPEVSSDAQNKPTKYQVTAAVDVYQLGLVLGVLCHNLIRWSVQDVCEVAGCSYADGAENCTPHSNLIELPFSAKAQVPRYLQEIINACRWDVIIRPTAKELLAMFPSVTPASGLSDSADTIFTKQHVPLVARQGQSITVRSNVRANNSKTSTNHITPQTLEKVRAIWNICRLAACSHCFGDCTTSHGHRRYHCNTCEHGDFDICGECFDAGLHCTDNTHFVRYSHPEEGTEWYYSSAGEDGKREKRVLR